MRLRLVSPGEQTDDELLAEARVRLETERATVRFLTERVVGLLRSLDQLKAVLDEQSLELDRMRTSRLS